MTWCLLLLRTSYIINIIMSVYYFYSETFLYFSVNSAGVHGTAPSRGHAQCKYEQAQHLDLQYMQTYKSLDSVSTLKAWEKIFWKILFSSFRSYASFLFYLPKINVFRFRTKETCMNLKPIYNPCILLAFRTFLKGFYSIV